jgi:membrane-associated phospholipid phosphatase
MTTQSRGALLTALRSVILPLVLLAAAMIGLGLLVTHALVRLWPLTIEDPAVRALAAARTPTWNTISNVVSLIAYTVGLTTVIVLVSCLMRIAYHRWREGLFLAAAMLAQIGVFMLTARVVGRARPPVPHLDTFPPMRSFPSGHAAAAVALYGGIAVILSRHARNKAQAATAWALLLIIPIAVGISRVYRGMHYPSDVIASFIIGLGCLWILQRAMLTPTTQRELSES